MQFCPEHLKKVRENLGMNKAQAARFLNMSAMGYGRYEKGEREPSFQVVSYIAERFGTTTDYLYGLSNHKTVKSITIYDYESPELFELVTTIKNDTELTVRLLSYIQKIDGQ